MVDTHPYLQSRFDSRVFGQKVVEISGIPEDMQPPSLGFHPPHRVARSIRRYFPDVIHQHWATWSLPAVAASRLDSTPLIVDVHGYDLFLPKPNLRSYLSHLPKVVEKRAALSQATAVITHSQYMAAEVTKVFGGTVHLLRHGVDTEHFAPQNVNPTEKVIFLGRLSPEKGPHLFLEALKTIPHQKRPPARIIGDGPLMRDLRVFAQENGLSVEFAGRLDRSQLPAELSSARSMVCPSVQRGKQSEAAGIAPMEAQACGTPVIATQCGGLTESLARELGPFVSEPTVEGLADSITRMLDSDSIQMRQAVRRYAEQFLDVRVKASELGAIYDETTEQRQA